jgi:uncharacterized protein (DUF2267 family)
VRYDELVKRVADRAALSREDADRAIRAVLRTLAERIGSDEADDLAAQLPKELKDEVPSGLSPERFGADEFGRRVAARAGIAGADGRELAIAVFAVLRQAVTDGEIEDVLDRLPDELDALVLAG